MEKAIIEVEGMTCGHCSNAVRNLIEELSGVESAEVDLSTKRAVVGFNESTSPETIVENINSSNIYKAKQI